MRSIIIDRAKLAALPWPVLRPIRAEQLCPYAEPKANRHTLHEMIKKAFDTPDGAHNTDCEEQFCYILQSVICENVDPRDKRKICFGDVPSGVASFKTVVPYSAQEVAAWWNEAITRIPPRTAITEQPAIIVVPEPEKKEPPCKPTIDPTPVKPVIRTAREMLDYIKSQRATKKP